MLRLYYDIPYEVTKRQYDAVMRDYASCAAGREGNGKYYVKVWLMQYARAIMRTIEELDTRDDA